MIKILYIVEPMIGIGPGVDANLLAKTAIKQFPDVDMLIYTDSQVPVVYTNERIKFILSQPWRYNPITAELYDLNKNRLEDKFKNDRKNQMIDLCKEYQPDVLLLHNYISGSTWDSIIDFEILPLIEFAKSINPRLKVYSYLIGMIDSFENLSNEDEKRFLQNVEKNIDKILLRSDNPELFFKTCEVARKIKEKFIPVGYAVDKELPKRCTGSDEKYFIVSAGGGDFGLNLFMKAIETCAHIQTHKSDINEYKWKIFLGPMQLEKELQDYINKFDCQQKIEIITNADANTFLSFLSYNCLVSISQCGQRTFTDLEVSGALSVVVPRESMGKEYEQLYRAQYLQEAGRATMIHEYDLDPHKLSEILNNVSKESPRRLGLRMDGPENLFNYIINDANII